MSEIAPFLSYVPLKTKFEKVLCKVSQNVFLKLEKKYKAMIRKRRNQKENPTPETEVGKSKLFWFGLN